MWYWVHGLVFVLEMFYYYCFLVIWKLIWCLESHSCLQKHCFNWKYLQLKIPDINHRRIMCSGPFSNPIKGQLYWDWGDPDTAAWLFWSRVCPQLSGADLPTPLSQACFGLCGARATFEDQIWKESQGRVLEFVFLLDNICCETVRHVQTRVRPRSSEV